MSIHYSVFILSHRTLGEGCVMPICYTALEVLLERAAISWEEA